MEVQFQRPKISFWQVIQESTIVIPQIQRDYAQGRNDTSVIEIRTRIIDRFFEAINNPKKSIDIDFVYGYISNNIFIPLDGQQRLTTLFLIHLYISKRAGIVADELRKFRYETRQSSTDFCKTIIDAKIPFGEIIDIEEWIPDQRWFFHSWKKDPTIVAMLTMLQRIHQKFNGSDFLALWNNIVKNNPITFNFLSIDNTGLTDELYIKMNSRGKPLTRFENFKVWFEKKYPEKKDWQKKIDNEWTNLFWKYRNVFKAQNSDDNTMDDEFLQFINGMLLFGLGLKGNKTEVLYFANTSDISLSKYEDENLNFFSKEEVDKIAKALDWLCKNNESLNDVLNNTNFWQQKSLLEVFISNKVTYSDRIIFYSIIHYIIQTDNLEFDKEAFQRWMRVMRNLIENSSIDSPETFIDSIKSINSIGVDCKDIYSIISNPENKITFFLSSQVVEEKLKVSLIQKNEEWLREIIDAENHELFRGCIGFLLNDEQTDLASFVKLKNIAKTIFDKDGSRFKSDYSLIRATLSNSGISSNIKLLDNGENWRVLLKRKEIQTALLPILFAFSSIDESNYHNVLNNIISDYQDKSVLWKYYVIKNEVLLTSDTSKSKIIKEYGGFYYLFNNDGANWINNDNQFLLSNYRNELISKLLSVNSSILQHRPGDWWMKQGDTANSYFYRGGHIWLKKEVGSYNLWFQFKQNEVIVGFRTDEKENFEIKEVKEECIQKIDGWEVAKNLGKYTQDENEFDNWVDIILKEIPEIEKLVSV